MQSLKMGVQDKSCRVYTGHSAVYALRITFPSPYFSEVEGTKQ